MDLLRGARAVHQPHPLGEHPGQVAVAVGDAAEEAVALRLDPVGGGAPARRLPRAMTYGADGNENIV